MGITNTARTGLLTLLVASLVLAALPATAGAAEPTFVPVKRYNVVRKMVFPVVGQTKFRSSFGDCRDNCAREHFGVDILTYGWKGQPVVAAHAGTVTRVTYDQRNAGCSVRIRAKDRWETRYLHMNNDFPGTDDIGFPCVAPGIEVGATVEAGQIIGWIGDSGNSEDTVPHIHFELRNRSGYPIDPYRSLRKANRISFEWLPSDSSAASILISQANNPEGVRVAFAVTNEEAKSMFSSDGDAFELDAPLIVVDTENPQPGLDELSRISPQRIVIFSNRDVNWLTERLRSGSRIVEIAQLPTAKHHRPVARPDGDETDDAGVHLPDRFPTIVAGDTSLVWRGYVDSLGSFVERHQSLVLTTDARGARNIGQPIEGAPDRDARNDLLWWNTGDGWVGTETLLDAPPLGIAYVRERLATPWTLAFLASLAETPRMPRWRE